VSPRFTVILKAVLPLLFYEEIGQQKKRRHTIPLATISATVTNIFRLIFINNLRVCLYSHIPVFPIVTLFYRASADKAE